MKSRATSFILIVAVIAVVGGVAWYRSAPANKSDAALSISPDSPAPDSKPAAESAAKSADEPVAETAATPVKEGQLCPDPPPTAKTDDPPAGAKTHNPPPTVQADEPTTNVTTAPAEVKKMPRVVDLGADKCIPCKKLAPILEELKKEYEGRVAVEFIDVWKDPKAGEPYKIRLIPTQVFFDAEGREVWRHEGFLPKEDFVAKFKELGVK
jgi:thioredoxin 1